MSRISSSRLRREARAELDLVVERADASLVLGQQPEQELFGGLAQQRDVAGHAAARVEHDDDRDRLNLVLEENERLRLVVVENLEVFLHQVRHEPPLRVGDGDEERYDLRAGSEGRLLREPSTRQRREQRDEQTSLNPCPQLTATALPKGRATVVGSLYLLPGDGAGGPR